MQGTGIEIQPDVQNSHDRNALKVLKAGSGELLGYLPRLAAKYLASYFARRGPCQAKVWHIGSETHKGRVQPTIRVELDLHLFEPAGDCTMQYSQAGRVRGISGIYRIFNKVNQRSYVGSSSDTGARGVEHIELLNNFMHHNELLQEDWNTMGPSAFTFDFLEKAKVDELASVEAKHVQQLGAYEIGYNATPDGRGVVGSRKAERRKKVQPVTETVVIHPAHERRMSSRGSGCLLILCTGTLLTLVICMLTVG